MIRRTVGTATRLPNNPGATIFGGAPRPLTQIFNLYPSRMAPFQTGLLRNPKQRIWLARDHQMEALTLSFVVLVMRCVP